MTPEALRLGFVPLTDAAPLVMAHEIGFAAEEGLTLDLVAAPSWSALRDRLVLGDVAAAHMLAPVPVAMALGLGGMAAEIDVLAMLSVGGNVIGVTTALAGRMRAGGFDFGFADAGAAGTALLTAATGRLRVGVPFPFSMHAELVYHWLGALGLPTPQGLDVRTVPPSRMAAALAGGEIDAFCVGEPWGSIAVEGGHGALVLPGTAIWAGAPEKALAVRRDWAEADPDRAARLIRAVWRAQRWLDRAENVATASDILARREYLNMSADVTERALTGHFAVDPGGLSRSATGFLRFHRGAAGFPWRSQAAWMATRLAARNGLDRAEASARAQAIFRTDLYRAALAPTQADLPGASSKVEGMVQGRTAVASQRGSLILEPDAFFDGSFFDPAADA